MMKVFRDGRGQFLGMYEIEADDIDKTMALRRARREKEREQGRHVDFFVPVWRDVLWRLTIERAATK
jgi:hypothetical protein